VSWCPNGALTLVAAAVDSQVLLVNTGVGDKLANDRTTELLSEVPDNAGYVASAHVAGVVRWEAPDSHSPPGTLVALHHFKAVKGDYYCTVVPEGLNRSVPIHQLSK